MTNITPQIRLIDGKPVTTSRQLAEFFHKRHDHVIDKIKALECSDQFLTSNFSGVKYNHRGNEYTEYQITRDGFAFLAMGFTGKKAAVFKEAYINAFNQMEAKLIKQDQLCHSLPDLTVRDKQSLKKVIRFYTTRLYLLNSSFEKSALIAYLMEGAKAYSIDRAVEAKLDIRLDTALGVLADERSLLLDDGLDMRNNRMGYRSQSVSCGAYKWLVGYFNRQLPLIDAGYIPE